MCRATTRVLPAAPETPTRFSAGPFARVDSSSNSNVADDFEDLDAGVISRFPPRHSASYEQRPGRGMGNDHDHPSGVDQWLKLAEESLTAGASRAASDLVALLAAVKRGSTAKARLPGEDDPRLAGENPRIPTRRVGFFRGKSQPRPHTTTGAALVRSLGPATRFFLPAAIAAIAAIVILACVARGPAAGSHGTGGSPASIAAPAPPAAQPRDASARHSWRAGIQPDCPARVSTRGTTTNDASRRPCPSSPRDDDDDDARARSRRRTAVRRESPRLGGGARAFANTAVARVRDVAELETRLAEPIASSEQLRRDVDEQAREKSVWKRSSERWYDAYQREREERQRDEAAKKSSWTPPRARHDRAGSTRAGTRRSIRRRRVRRVRRRRTSADDRCCT